VPLGRGIVEVFEAIPERIEVSGHGPTWRVTGGSFESALAFAEEAFGDTVVVAREDRRRWWPRVTLTVTRDPELAADAPPVETFADRPEPEAAATAPTEPESEPQPETEPDLDSSGDTASGAREPASYESTLDEIFTRQEARRAARRHIPEQRSGG
jgi:hypothetical protein